MHFQSSGMQYIHGRDVIHRDLKSSNGMKLVYFHLHYIHDYSGRTFSGAVNTSSWWLCRSKILGIFCGLRSLLPSVVRPVADVTKTWNRLENRPENGPENWLGFHALNSALLPDNDSSLKSGTQLNYTTSLACQPDCHEYRKYSSA